MRVGRTEVCGGGGLKRNLRDVDELKATIAAAARTAGVGLVFEANLATDEHTSLWVLQGVALSLNTDA